MRKSLISPSKNQVNTVTSTICDNQNDLFFLSYFSFFLLCAMHIDLDCLIFVQKLIRKYFQNSEFLDCNLDFETHKQFITFLVLLNLTLLFDASLKSFFSDARLHSEQNFRQLSQCANIMYDSWSTIFHVFFPLQRFFVSYLV